MASKCIRKLANDANGSKSVVRGTRPPELLLAEALGKLLGEWLANRTDERESKRRFGFAQTGQRHTEGS